MTNLRLTIAMFILAAALAPAFLISWYSGQDAKQVQAARQPVKPIVPPGFKSAPWEGVSKKRSDDPTQPSKPAPAQPAATTSPAPAVASQPSSPVVVELFTSEGCSSCPPAEKLINQLAAAQPADSNTFFLAYHVDYWDKLGWKDRFASKAFTDRQHAYAKAFNTESVYTPQTVINGEVGFVGSDKPNTESVIASAKRRAAKLTLTATRPEIKPDQAIKVECKLAPIGDGKLPGDLRVCAVLVENGLTTPVKHGENEGRTLNHDRVVRDFAEVTPSADGAATIGLKVPADLSPENASVVVFVQETKTMKVIAATMASAP